MFTYKKGIWQSSSLKVAGVAHGFSTRLGGKSTLSHTASMNTGYYRGDDDSLVTENIKLLCRLSGASENIVGTPQIHSNIVRYVTEENIGEGISKEVPFECDGFVTDRPNVTLLIRTADCVPILLCGRKADGAPVIAAVHAGWKGTVADIAAVAAAKMRELGADDISAAVGACIHKCCFQVGEDFVSAVTNIKDADFVCRHVEKKNGSYYADLTGMNREILTEAGVENIDIISECTLCKPYLYHSHRATGGKRGTMGSVISITK
ncbi:MAG: peptidoglycan editing factor PgeF [Clostridia bacterium]|nr:peptidoglycan editing factor PgeF [Clostridia bacterium]